MKKLKLNPEIDWIIDVLRNSELGELYVDIETGEVILISRYNKTTDLDLEELMFDKRYLEIPDLSDSSYDMKNFIESIQDVKLRSQLKKAFYEMGKGGFKRVKTIVGNEWNNFEYQQIKFRLQDWLKFQGIEIINQEIKQKHTEDKKTISNSKETKVTSKCVAVVWRFTGDYLGEYCIVIFSSVRLVNYQSLYWWTDKFLGYQSSCFEDVKQQLLEVSKKNQLPLLWGVGHLVKAGKSTSAEADYVTKRPQDGFDYHIYGFYPIDEQGNQLELKSETTLKEELGLTSKQIKDLGEPDAIRKNPISSKFAPMKLYLVNRARRLLENS